MTIFIEGCTLTGNMCSNVMGSLKYIGKNLPLRPILSSRGTVTWSGKRADQSFVM